MWEICGYCTIHQSRPTSFLYHKHEMYVQLLHQASNLRANSHWISDRNYETNSWRFNLTNDLSDYVQLYSGFGPHERSSASSGFEFRMSQASMSSFEPVDVKFSTDVISAPSTSVDGNNNYIIMYMCVHFNKFTQKLILITTFEMRSRRNYSFKKKTKD